jgi:transcriptional regulator with XRE-family HTH domain
MKPFNEKLIELRNERGLRQKDVADALAIAQPTYSLYEAGKRETSFSMLIRIACYFGVTTDYLLGLEDVRTHDKSMLIEMLNDREARLYRYREQLCRIYMEIGDVLNANTTQS